MDMSGMDGMSNSDSGSMSMTMEMVFTNTYNTPLFSKAWTPSSTGGYAGTCIFLIVLAIISRLLAAYRARVERAWHDKAVNRRYVMVAEQQSEPDRERQAIGKGGEKVAEAVLTANGLDERVKVVKSAGRGLEGKPWRFTTDLPRASLYTVDSGVKYLLMLAVMTMNVGYFLSVLGGLFAGELAVGRYTATEDGHH